MQDFLFLPALSLPPNAPPVNSPDMGAFGHERDTRAASTTDAGGIVGCLPRATTQAVQAALFLSFSSPV